VTRSYRPASPGTGSLRTGRPLRARRPGGTRAPAGHAPRLAGMLLALVMVQAGCSPDVKDGLGPRVAIPNVSGRVEREGSAASALDVTVRDANDISIASAKTDAGGLYSVAVPAGVWEIKAKGKVPGDFDSVTRGFVVSSTGQQFAMDSLDIFAYQAALVFPADAATLGLPSGSDPVTFRWSPPRTAIVSARVQLYAGGGEAVWFSARSSDSSAVWDGTGNQGAWAGIDIQSGTYTWRVKFDLPDSSEARTESRSVTFQ
jgi:hypothetical protein